MTKRLDHLLHQNAIWSKAINSFQLTFTPYDPKNIRSTITSLGVLIQNGKKKINTFSHGKLFLSQFLLPFYFFLLEQTNGIDQRKTTQSKTNDKSDNTKQSTILLDTSEDFCAVCRCGGELVCCDECPRVYHVDCHVPSLNEISMNEKWKCSLCSEIPNLLKRKHDDMNENFSTTDKQICEKLVLQMYTHPSSAPFHQPVPADVS